MRKTEGVYLLLAVTAYCADGGVIQRVLSSRAQAAVFGSGQKHRLSAATTFSLKKQLSGELFSRGPVPETAVTILSMKLTDK